jgi:hypothetical protein
MTTIGSVEDYDKLRELDPGKYDIVLLRQQKLSPFPIPFSASEGGIFAWDKEAKDVDDGSTLISPNSSPTKGRWKRQFLDALSVSWFGAKGDMNQHYVDTVDKKIYLHRGNIKVRENVFELTSSNFDSNDIGKTIVIWKPGTEDGYLVSKIVEVRAGLKSVKLLDSAKVDLFDAYVAWGTDDTNAIKNAIKIAGQTGLAVYLPPGRYIVTNTLNYSTIEPERDKLHYWPDTNYPIMEPGLRIFGAGMQVSFIYSLMENDSGNATIKLDGTGDIAGRKKYQQTGHLKDFSISSVGYFKPTILTKGIETKGIELVATWAYTIENVAIMNMGSDGINIRNKAIESGSSDWDQTDKLRLDNIFLFQNHGWGIKVDAGEGGASTSKIHIDRCKIEKNESGGIQWTGQGGTIERCGIYGNGADPSSGKETYGILVKNVKATSNGLLIIGCEIQDNANVQLMIAVGANIRIVQNDFKIDKTDGAWFWPLVDVQVGDGNLEGGPGQARTVNGCVMEDNRIRGSFGLPQNWHNAPPHTVVKVHTNAVGTVVSRWWTTQYAEDTKHKFLELVDNVTPVGGIRTLNDRDIREGFIHAKTHLIRDWSSGSGGHVLLPFASTNVPVNENKISEPKDKQNMNYVPDTSRWSSYYFDIRDLIEDLPNTPPNKATKRVLSLTLCNPTMRTSSSPLFLEFVNNCNRVPRDIIVYFSSEYNVGSSIIIPHRKKVTGILMLAETGEWTSFSPWTCDGKPL